MSEILRAEGLQKTFRLSAKQQKLEKTRSRTKVAVRDLSFSVQEGRFLASWDPMAQVKPRRCGFWPP